VEFRAQYISRVEEAARERDQPLVGPPRRSVSPSRRRFSCGRIRSAN